MNRRHIRAPRIYRWGRLVMAFALCWQLAFGLMVSDSGVRLTGALIGGTILLAGLIVMIVGQLGGGTQKGGGTL